MAFSCPVRIIAIPDGIHGSKLRISLSIVPLPEREAAFAHADLTDWPTKIASLAESMKVAVAEIVVAPDGSYVHANAAYILTGAKFDLTGATYDSAATARWKKIFNPNGGEQGFAALKRYVDSKAAGPPKPPGLAAPKFDFYSSAELGGFLEQLYQRAGQRALNLKQAILNLKESRPPTDPETDPAEDHQPPNSLESGELSESEWKLLESFVPWTGGDPLGRMDRKKPTDRLNRINTLRTKLAQSILGRHGVVPDRKGEVRGNLNELDQLYVDTNKAFADADIAPSTSTDSIVPSSNRLIEDTFSRFAATWGLLAESSDPDNCPNPPPEDADPDKSHAARKLSAILSYPTLAKYFGLTVDLYIDKAKIPADGAIAVVFSTGAPDAKKLDTWTAFEKCDDYFGPAAKPRPANKQPSYSKGLVNLRESSLSGGKFIPRYAIRQVDTTNGIKRLSDRAISVGEVLRSGGTLADAGGQMPDLHEGGLELVDSEKQIKAYSDLSGAAVDSSSIHFAEDLVRGMRLDVAMSDADGKLDVGDASRWRTLVARQLRYGIDQHFLSDSRIQRVGHRDDGFVNTAASMMRTVGRSLSIDVPQGLTSWTGESLGVPANIGDPQCEEIWLHPDTDLAIDIDFDLPGEPAPGQPDLRPSLLRYGRGYRMGARAVYLNGCGLSFVEARAQYTNGSKTMLLGDEQTQPEAVADPFRYGRLRKVQAPEVLLPWDEKLTTDPSGAPGETIETLVIRSHGPVTRRARRFLVPSRLGVEQVEQHGKFDDDDSKNSSRPKGAFREMYRAELDETLGAFPVARNGQWEFPASLVPVETEREKSQGIVFVANAEAPETSQEYHPDPLARSFQGRLYRVEERGVMSGDPIEFWGVDKHPRSARPALLELKPAPRDTTPYFDGGDQLATLKPYSGEAMLRLPKLSIALGPSDQMFLELSAVGDSNIMMSEFRGFRKAIPRQDPIIPAAVADRLMRMGAVAPWTGSRRLRLVHAVERPLDPPTMVRIHPVVVTVFPEQSAGKPKWSDYICVDPSKACPEPLKLLSVEGGATTFFVGDATIHARSTGRIRCEGKWIEHGPAGLRHDPDGWTYDPPNNFARLFGIDDIDPNGSGTIDFAKDGQTVRGLNYSFPDGRAREIDIELVATSRFTDYYDAEGEPGRHDLASDTITTMVPCTFRPPVPEIDRILPVLRWQNRTNARRTEFSFKRTSAVRIFLKPNIYASGHGEKLGVLFWTDGDPNGDLCAFEAATGTQGQKVTQWGHDPIQNPLAGAPTLRFLPRPADFSGWSEQKPGVLIPAPDDQGSASENSADNRPLPVHVLGFTPKIDKREGAYCDVEVDTVDTYSPFVRLGLARYQPNACKGLELSHPVTKTVQILPWRTGSVSIRKREVHFTVRGPGYTGRELRTFEEDPRRSTMLSVKLMRAVPRSGQARSNRFPPGWLPVLDGNGQPVEFVSQAPEINSGLAEWSGSLHLPRPRPSVHYGLVIEEVEWIDSEPLVADGRCPPTQDAKPASNPMPRSPIFLHIVDLDPDLEIARESGGELDNPSEPPIAREFGLPVEQGLASPQT